MSDIFKGAAKPIEDIDLPRIGSKIGVGEDPLHAFIETETLGHGFDKQGRVIILFEPHVFYSLLRGEKRAQAVTAGLAYKNWGERPYPKESYTRLIAAMEIDATAALMACSWGMGQIMGKNYDQVGFDNVEDMVRAFAESEANQLEAVVEFLITNNIDDDLRRLETITASGRKVTANDCIPIVRVYNGKGYARNNYHVRFAAAYNRWLKIKDTPYAGAINIKDAAAIEEQRYEDEPDAVMAEAPPSNDAPKPAEPEKVDEAPAPTESAAQKVQRVAQSLGSKIMAGGTAGGGVGGAVLLGVLGILKNPYIIAGLILSGFVIGAWLWNESKKRQAMTQNKLIDAAASKDLHTVAITPPVKAG